MYYYLSILRTPGIFSRRRFWPIDASGASAIGIAIAIGTALALPLHLYLDQFTWVLDKSSVICSIGSIDKAGAITSTTRSVVSLEIPAAKSWQLHRHCTRTRPRKHAAPVSVVRDIYASHLHPRRPFNVGRAVAICRVTSVVSLNLTRWQTYFLAVVNKVKGLGSR